MEKFPESKRTWDISEAEAGNRASSDPGSLEVTKDVDADGLPFGVFADLNPATKKLRKLVAGSTASVGLTLISNLARDYENRKYNADDKAAVARRGFFLVKIDINNIFIFH